jgi:serine/threonine-protein kinase
MAPEQFHGKAVFASDLYSLGVSMYQMLTGVLPYDTPAPADIERLLRGELISAPRLRNPAIPKRLNDVVLHAMAPDLGARYQRAADLLADLLEIAHELRRPPTPARAVVDAGRPSRQPAASHDDPSAAVLASRLRSREPAAPRFCWHCRKPLHARSDRCPFCGETQ